MKMIHDMKDGDMDRLLARAALGKKARSDEKAEMTRKRMKAHLAQQEA